ncbi:MAG: hypothetical protein AB7S38_40600 [Vulcanimicrobiota bacterium]
MTIESSPEMLKVAQRVVWHLEPEEALRRPLVFLAHVMTLGTTKDIVTVERVLGREAFRVALDAAPPGHFDPRSWAYWNLLFDRWPPPPLPERDLSNRFDTDPTEA